MPLPITVRERLALRQEAHYYGLQVSARCVAASVMLRCAAPVDLQDLIVGAGLWVGPAMPAVLPLLLICRHFQP